MHTRVAIAQFCPDKRPDFGTISTYQFNLLILFIFYYSVQLLNKLKHPN